MNLIWYLVLPVLFCGISASYCGCQLAQLASDQKPGSVVLDKRGTLLATFLCLVVGGGLFALCLIRSEFQWSLPLRLLFCFDLLVPAALIDARHQIIPNRLILGGIVGTIAFMLAELLAGSPSNGLLWELLLGLTMGGGVFLLCTLLTRGGIGMGDVKLFGVLGMLLGWAGVFDLIFLSVLLVAVYGISLLVRRKLTRTSQVPIGPFALAGLSVMMLLG